MIATMNVKSAYTANEMAILLDITPRTVLYRAQGEGWGSRPREGRGGGNLWLVASMPRETRDLLASSLLRAKRESAQVSAQPPVRAPQVPTIAQQSALARPIPAPAPSITPTLARASNRERRVAMARLAFVREVESLAAVVGKEGAIRHILNAIQSGELSPDLAAHISTANTYKRMLLSRRSLYRWCTDYANGGEAALLPGSRPKAPVPAWAADFFKHYAKPQKPMLTDAYSDFYDEMAARGMADIPSIHMCRRIVAKMSLPEREAGRATGNALLKLRPHKRRSTVELWPTDVYTADGTTFDAEILHPYHGQPFKPELTAVLDVATRRCVGLSISLAETALTVLDALRMGACFGGIPALFYSDNGPGYVNGLMQNDYTGIFPRLGIEFTASIPGRPQGKGLMERGVKTLWVKAAQGLASYTGSLMDTDTAHKNFKLSRKQIKSGKAGRKCRIPTWEDFKAHILRRVEEYNASPHRGLPKFTDAEGRQRHFSPNEYWQSFVMRGFSPVTVPDTMRHELFMPAERRKVHNGWIEFYKGRYYAHQLAEFHGEYVEVRYDVWDSSKIYCWTLDRKHICTAAIDGNSIPYFPQTRIEAAQQKREKAQIGRIDAKLQRIVPGAEIVLPQREQMEIADSTTPHSTITVEAQTVAVPEAPAPECRPLIFTSTYDKFRWLMQHSTEQTETDAHWLKTYASSEEYAEMKDLYSAQGFAYA